jgi:hypothetical protein
MTVTANPTGLPLTPYLLKRVSLTGPIPHEGTFKGTLTVRYGGAPDVYTLVVERVAPRASQITVDVIGSAPAEQVLPWCPEILPSPPEFDWRGALCGATAHVRVSVTEAGGHQAKFDSPAISKLVLVGTNNSETGVDKYRVDPPTQVVPATPVANSLMAYQNAEYELVIHDIGQPGQFQATVQVQPSGGAVASDTASVTVKHGCLFPALVIFLGVLLSVGLHYWQKIRRPRAVEEIAIAGVLKRINEEIDEQDPVSRDLKGRLNDLLLRNQIEPQTDVNTELAATRKVVDNFEKVRRVLDLDKDNALELVLEDQEREGIHRELAGLRGKLDEPGRLAALEGDTLVALATDIQDRFEDQARKSMKGRLDKLKQALTDLPTHLKPGETPTPGQSTDIEQATAAIEQAANELESSTSQRGPLAVQRLVAARNSYNDAQTLYSGVHDELAQAGALVTRGSVPGRLAGRRVIIRTRTDRPNVDRARLVQYIQRNDLIALAITVFVAVVLGLQLLWANTADFGSPVDYISAFLWGFGLHELQQTAAPAVLARLGGSNLSADERT